MSNLEIYNKLASPPQEALKTISGGRLSGFTDINPMWRIKAMTEAFGVCGVGWKYEIVRLWCEVLEHMQPVAAFAEIKLYVKDGDKWSDPIPGIGGSGLVEIEKEKPRTNDECYKMALTDALSVAMKALGMAGTVYWQQDPTKYTSIGEQKLICPKCNKPIEGKKVNNEVKYPADILEACGSCFECWQADNKKKTEAKTEPKPKTEPKTSDSKPKAGK